MELSTETIEFIFTLVKYLSAVTFLTATLVLCLDEQLIKCITERVIIYALCLAIPFAIADAINSQRSTENECDEVTSIISGELSDIAVSQDVRKFVEELTNE